MSVQKQVDLDREIHRLHVEAGQDLPPFVEPTEEELEKMIEDKFHMWDMFYDHQERMKSHGAQF